MKDSELGKTSVWTENDVWFVLFARRGTREHVQRENATHSGADSERVARFGFTVHSAVKFAGCVSPSRSHSRPSSFPTFKIQLSMKSLRRSFNGGKDHHYPSISTPIPSAVPGLPSVSKPSASFTPPTKVIRALGEHRKEAADQLSFSKGDFFHVVRDKDENWYEANNPVTGARGLVPKFKFEEFGRSNAA